jgi:hypothetical protein
MKETQNVHGKHVSVAVICAGIFLAIYFLCPPLLACPVILFNRHLKPPRRLDVSKNVFFRPIQLCESVVPVYGKVVRRECRAFGIRVVFIDDYTSLDECWP